MILEQGVNNRVLIYFFYDGQGIVDDYVIHSLKGFRPYIKNIIFVCNGKLTDSGKEKVTPHIDQLIVRENEGFDGWAYKAGIDSLGWEKLGEYDEMIMANHTIMGPIDTLEEMFRSMDARDIDFWGISKNKEIEYDFTGWSKYHYIPEHVQSHFIAVRKKMIQSKAYHEYWDKFPQILNYSMAVGCHEAIFTKHFADLGFTWDTLCDISDIEDMCDYHLLNMPVAMLKKGCPFFKRRSFFHEYGIFLEQSIGTSSMELMNYLEKETHYDTNMIWDNILRTCNMEDISKCLQLNYVLPTNMSDDAITAEIGKKKRVALLIHVYFEDLFDDMIHYMSSMPEYADVYVTVSSEEKKKILEEKLKVLKVNKVEVVLCNNRGRDVSASLIIGKDLMDKYDYICFAHDKKTKQLKNGLCGQGFADRCFNNILYNKHLVANILRTLEENPRLGMLGTPFPNHGEFYQLYGWEWTLNFANTKQLAEDLGIHVPMDEKKMPITAYGSMFWFRTDALRKLYEKDWKYEDFPDEPLPVDATISHAIERVRPFVAQGAGYYSAFVQSDIYARVEYTNLTHYLRGSKPIGPMQYIRELEERVTFKGFMKRIFYRLFPFVEQKWDFQKPL